MPEVAMPLIRPLCALRNLVRIGCSMASNPFYPSCCPSGGVAARPAVIAFRDLLVLRHRVVLHDLALEDPDLDAAGAVGGESGGDAVVDIGAQRGQRHAALA